MRKIQKEQLDNDFGNKDVSPISHEILAETLPSKFKLSTLDKYNGKTDPDSRLVNFLHNHALSECQRCDFLPGVSFYPY